MTYKHRLFYLNYNFHDFETAEDRDSMTADIQGVNKAGIDTEWFNPYILENANIANLELSGSRYFELIRVERRDSCALFVSG